MKQIRSPQRRWPSSANCWTCLGADPPAPVSYRPPPFNMCCTASSMLFFRSTATINIGILSNHISYITHCASIDIVWCCFDVPTIHTSHSFDRWGCPVPTNVSCHYRIHGLESLELLFGMRMYIRRVSPLSVS